MKNKRLDVLQYIIIIKLQSFKQYNRICRYMNETELKVSKLANKYANFIYYKSNSRTKGEIWNIQYMVFVLVSSHLEKR